MTPQLVLAVGCLLAPIARAQSGPQLSGDWEITLNRFGEPRSDRLVLNMEGAKISGSAFGDIKVVGTLTGDKVQLELSDRQGAVAVLAGMVNGQGLSGTGTMANDKSEFTWTARRSPARPPDAPRHYEFQATEYHRYFSATTPPALHIFPGDSVHTNTVDAGGWDKDHIRRSMGGNPLSGPFYVEGAAPGDTLVVHFTKIRLNRDTAESGDSIAPTALNPGYFKHQKEVTDFDSTWKLDRDRGVGTLAKPTDKLKNFKVELHPMLGCVGVAPPQNQSIRSGELGDYGGNMDYNQIQEGVTLYLPVAQDGALLYVGDGHALQGDGELTGDALETSMEVEFTVDLIRGKSFGGVRAENDEYIMATGVGGSLQDSLQRATTVLARWIEDGYGLNPSEVAMVLGTSIKYDIAEVVDPHVNVVAKVKKSVLAQLTKVSQ
ncbi:MAG TPA: acetamidase/formamidase family protein [Blastocatellia bacterium]